MKRHLPRPQLFITRFFQLAQNRDFAESERLLQKIKEKMSGSEWSKGYHLALEGILLALRNKDDKYVFVNRFETNKENFERLEAEFYKRAKNVIEPEFDRGYFSAWADFIRVVKSSGNTTQPIEAANTSGKVEPK